MTGSPPSTPLNVSEVTNNEERKGTVMESLVRWKQPGDRRSEKNEPPRTLTTRSGECHGRTVTDESDTSKGKLLQSTFMKSQRKFRERLDREVLDNGTTGRTRDKSSYSECTQ